MNDFESQNTIFNDFGRKLFTKSYLKDFLIWKHLHQTPPNMIQSDHDLESVSEEILFNEIKAASD
jgi:hypothetical protein